MLKFRTSGICAPRYRGPALIVGVRDCVVTVQHLDGTVQKVNDKKIKPAHGWLKEDFEAAKKSVYPNSLPSRPDVSIRDVWDEENVITVDIVPPLRMALRDAMCPALEDPELKLPARPADTLMSYGT